MTEIETIKNMIVDGEATYREINKATAKVFGWYYYTPSEAKKKFKRNYKRGAWIAPEDCTNGKPVFCQLHGTTVYNDCPDFASSIDEQKDLEVEGWLLNVSQTDAGYTASLRKGSIIRTNRRVIDFLPTEPLARLYCWLCVKQWEEQQND